MKTGRIAFVIWKTWNLKKAFNQLYIAMQTYLTKNIMKKLFFIIAMALSTGMVGQVLDGGTKTINLPIKTSISDTDRVIINSMDSSKTKQVPWEDVITSIFGDISTAYVPWADTTTIITTHAYMASNTLRPSDSSGGTTKISNGLRSQVMTTYTKISTIPSLTGAASSTTFLRGDNSWATPINTTYTAGTGLTLTGTTFSLTSPVTVALGGTGTGTAGITAFNNITGLSAAGTTGTTTTNLVFSTSPTLVTPILGTPTSGTLTNCTGFPAGSLTGFVGVGNGGTGINTGGSTGVPTVNTGTWSLASFLSPSFGGTGISTASTTGVPIISGGTWSVSSTLSATLGGTGQNSSAATGIAQVASGTWSFSTALGNGTTATTQTTGDATTKVATDAFVATATAFITHTIFTPTSGGTVTLVDNQINIINPTGSLTALTIAVPSTPSNNDRIVIKYDQVITTVTYPTNVKGGFLSPVMGTTVILTYDATSTNWY